MNALKQRIAKQHQRLGLLANKTFYDGRIIQMSKHGEGRIVILPVTIPNQVERNGFRRRKVLFNKVDFSGYIILF